MDVPVKDIKVARGGRKPRNVDELAASIAAIGLLHPVVLMQPGYRLVAGRRRLAAVKKLGWDTVPATIVENLDEIDS